MMTSSNGNIFRVTCRLCGEFTGHRWIPHKGQWRGALMFSLICAWIHGWVNNGEAVDLRRHRAHYDVTVMVTFTLAVNVLSVVDQAMLYKQGQLRAKLWPSWHSGYVKNIYDLLRFRSGNIFRAMVRRYHWFMITDWSDDWCASMLYAISILMYTLWSRHKGRHLAGDIFKCIFLNENILIPIKISLRFHP